MSDPLGVLINAQEGKTKALRQWRFSKKSEIIGAKIKPYLMEAIGLAVQGIEFKPVRNKPLVIPDELSQALQKKPALALAFNQLAKGKQREFSEYISDAKQDSTKSRRLLKILPMIEQGVGLNDKYKKH